MVDAAREAKVIRGQVIQVSADDGTPVLLEMAAEPDRHPTPASPIDYLVVPAGEGIPAEIRVPFSEYLAIAQDRVRKGELGQPKEIHA